ncbi:hypothetical protein B1R94_04125 [Mycolicibacterium litorale]|nr:hypothetical protein B1R94_04125 [Mycolicibacterium litorale]
MVTVSTDNVETPATTSSASTLSTACGAGCQPCSVNPSRPTVRDITKAPSAAREPPNAARRSHRGPPAAMSTARAAKTLAVTRNPVPTAGRYR